MVVGARGDRLPPTGSRYKWVYLWPLIGVYLDVGDVAEVVAAGRQLLDPSQQRLPDELDTMLRSASSAWARGEPAEARDNLATALTLVHDLHYL